MQLELISREPPSVLHQTPLLFVHGAWIGAWCWEDYFLPYFAQKGFRAYAVSLRGHGKSENDKPLRFTGVWDYVADVAEAVHQIESATGLRPAVIGHSMGGYVLQKFLEQGTLPAGVLLASVPSHGLLGLSLRIIGRYPLAALTMILQLRAYPLVADVKRVHALFLNPSVSLEQAREYHHRMQDEAARLYFDGLLFHRPNPRRVAGTPLLVIGAEIDRTFPMREIHATARSYHTEAMILPHTAHAVPLDPHWQEAADAIIAWLVNLGL